MPDGSDALASASDSVARSSSAYAQAPPAPPPIQWSAEAIEAGELQERREREPDRRNERRRNYRRIEDRDLISKAHEEVNAITERAEQQGYEQGLERAEAVVQNLQVAITQLMNAREEGLLSVANEIGALAIEVAARIIKTEVSCDDSLVMALVRDTIQKAGRSSKTILIKVNPEDAAAVKKSLRDDPIPNTQAELIVMDEVTVDLGSCIIETNSGMVDASFATQLGILRQMFGTGKA